jgi:ornithine decarboxylase
MKEEYQFPLEDYMSRERFERIKDFAKDKETPCLILDLDIVRQNTRNCAKTYPLARYTMRSKRIPTTK